MADPHTPAEELGILRQMLDGLESGSLTMSRNGVDVSKREAGILKREIAHLEDVIARLKRASNA
jgi:hypothetical protein